MMTFRFAAIYPLPEPPPRGRGLAASGYVHHGSMHIRGVVGSEPQRHSRDFLRPPRAAERNRLGERGVHAAVHIVDLGLDESRADRVDADAFGADFLRERERERVDRAL